MTKWIIEAEGEVVCETADQDLAEAMFDAYCMVCDTVTMHEEHMADRLH